MANRCAIVSLSCRFIGGLGNSAVPAGQSCHFCHCVRRVILQGNAVPGGYPLKVIRGNPTTWHPEGGFMRKAIIICNTVLACLASVLPASSALASTRGAAAAPPSAVVVTVVTVNGSGCPPGTASVALSPDNTAFTVTYSSYTALVGVGAAALD